MQSIRKYVSVLLSTTILALVGGCANLGEIREFGKLSADSAGYTQLTDDYLSSPVRQKKYTFSNEKEVRDKLDELMKSRAVQAEKLKLYHKAIESYMKALADLAGDEVTNSDKELGSLIDNAKSTNLVPQDQADALKSISSVLSDAATNLYRQRKLHDVIDRANAPLQNVISGLIFNVGSAYPEAINGEEQYFVSYYQVLLATAKEPLTTSKEPREPAAAQLIIDLVAEKRPAFESRRKAATAYVATLKNIGIAHQYLHDNRDRLSNDEVRSAMKHYATEIYSAYKKFAQASKTN